MKKVLSAAALILALMFVFCSCGEKDSGSQAETSAHQKVEFTMKDGGSFVVELYPEYAPETCENFINLVNEKFYDGLTFHRVIEGFMAQGGDASGTEKADMAHTIHGEFSSNGFTQNTLSHERGVISMARTRIPDSASSQFFICLGNPTFLDGNYAAFGRVIEGMETVDGFLKVKRVMGADGELSSPVEPIVIESARVIV